MTTDLDAVPTSADWCEEVGGITVCGTSMEEHSRTSEGIRWCFKCRTRHEFWRVLMVPAGLSYYGPSVHIEGVHRDCSDLFPGWYRSREDE